LRTGNGSALGTADGSTTISSGATLDVNGQNLGAEPVLVQGTGIGSSGAIINSGAGQNNALRFVTLQGNTTFGGTGRWDIRSADINDPGQGSLLTGGSSFDITKIGTNQISLVGITVDAALRNVDVQQGLFSIETATLGLGSATGTLTIQSGATLQIYQLANALNKNVVLNGNGVVDTLLAPSSTALGQNTLQPSGTITLNGACIFDVTAFLTLNGAINGGGSLTKIGTGTNFLAGTIGFSGSTIANSGLLVLNGTKTGGAGITVAATAALAGTGSTTEAVINNGTIIAGDPVNTPSATLTTGNLTLNSANASINVDAVGNRVIVNGGLTLNGVTTIQLTSQNSFSSLTSGQHITVIQYSGSLSGGLANLTLGPGPNGYSFSLINPATTPGTIQVSVDHVPQPLTWQGLSPSALTVWDAAGATNWINNNGSVLSQFTNGDNVTFDDSGTNLVTLSGTLNPQSITFNNSVNAYTLTGSGRITGSSGIMMGGSGGALTIANGGNNDFSGGITINGGLLQIGNGGSNGTPGIGPITNFSALAINLTNNVTVSNRIFGSGVFTNNAGVVTLSGNNSGFTGQMTVNGGTLRSGSTSAFGSTNSVSILVASNATLDINGQNLGTQPLTVGGPGAANNGAIVNSGAVQQNALQNVTLTGDTTFGGSGRWDIRSSFQLGASLSANGNPYNITKTGTNSIWLVNVSFDGAISNINVQSGLLGYQDSTSGLGDQNATLTVAAGASLGFFNSINPLSKIIALNGDGTNSAVTVTGTNVVSGPVSLSGECIFNLSTLSVLTLNGAVSGGGSLTEIGNGTLSLASTYSWSGNTTVGGGTLDLTFSASPTLNLGSGQTLKGNGTIIGGVTAGPGSTVAPGLSVGRLTVSDAINLGGTTIMELDKANGTNDLLRSTNSSITYGGTLIVTNLGGSFIGGETYKLFDSATASYLGSFSTIQLPSLPPGLSWNTNLSVNGTLSISGSAVLTKPTLAHISINGASVVLSGTNNTGPGGTYHVLISTNVTTPLSNWIVLTNGTFDSSGNFSSTNARGTSSRQFYILQVP
jgi:autotransporter-associated beta strand protein